MEKRKRFLHQLTKAEGLYQLSSVEATKAYNKFYPKKAFLEVAPLWALTNQGHVFFSPNPRKEASGKNSAVQYFNAFFADYDSEDKDRLKKRLKEFPIKPTAIIFSGRGYHIYWFLKEPAELPHDYFRGVQKGVATFLEADTTIHNPARLMRLPGSINRKNGKLVEVVYFAPKHETDPSEFELFYTPTHTIKTKHLSLGNKKLERVKKEEILSLPVSSATKKRILKGALEGAPSRSERDIRIVRALLALHWPPQKIISLFLDPRFGCSDKTREKGRDGLRYILFTIEKAKTFSTESKKYSEAPQNIVRASL